MTKSKTSFVERAKHSFATAASLVKKVAGNASDKIEMNSEFLHMTQKWKRINSNILNFSPSLRGIFDSSQSTLTIKAKEPLLKGELLQTGETQYRVEEIQAKPIRFPVEIDQVIHNMLCRVAVLKKI